MSRKLVNGNQLLDVFPTRPNQKVADKKDVLEVGRTTRSSKNKNLFTVCPYLNKVVEYEGTPKASNKKNTYSPEPQQRTPDVVPTRARGRSLAPTGGTSSRRAVSPVVQSTFTLGSQSRSSALGAPTGTPSANDALGTTPTAPSTLLTSKTATESPEEDEEVAKRTTRSLAKADVVFNALKYTSSDASDSSSSGDVRTHLDKKLRKEEIATPVASKTANTPRTIQQALNFEMTEDAPEPRLDTTENFPKTSNVATRAMDSKYPLEDAPISSMALKNAPGSSEQEAQKKEEDGAPGPSVPLLPIPATEATPNPQKRNTINEHPEEPSPKKQARVRLWVPSESTTKTPKKAASKKKVTTPKPKRSRCVGFRKRDLQNPVFTYHLPEPTEEEEFVPKYARTDEEVRREVHLKMGIIQ